MNEEIWKDIDGYDGMYQVSNLGNVRSLNNMMKCGKFPFVISPVGKTSQFGGHLDATRDFKLTEEEISSIKTRFEELFHN